MDMPSLLSPALNAQIEGHCAHLPEYCREGLIDYLRYGLPPGSFLQAVLSNDLAEACKRSDDYTRGALYDFVFVLYNYAPFDSWGNADRVKAWIRRGAELRRNAMSATA